MNDADTIGDGDDRIIAAEYVLGLLSAADRSQVEQRLNDDVALRAEVAHWQETFVSLTDPIPEVEPPARVWRGISATLDTPMTTRPKRWGIGLLGYALGGVLAAAVAWGVVTTGLLSPAAPEYQARIAAEDEAVLFLAAYDQDTGELALEYRAGSHPADRSFEFWMIAEGQAPEPLIVWPDGSRAETVTLSPEQAARVSGAVLAISDEPLGGSPTGQPTGQVVAVGPLQEI